MALNYPIYQPSLGAITQEAQQAKKVPTYRAYAPK